MSVVRIVAAVVAVLAGATALGPVPSASARSDPLEHIRLLSVRYAVAADGTIDVTETIDYSFRADNHTGRLTRRYPSRWPSEADPSKDQVWEYTDFAASSPTGAAAELSVSETYLDAETAQITGPSRRAETNVRFPHYEGPDRTERYVLTYRLRGAMRSNGLRGWQVAHVPPTLTDRTEVVVTAPGGVRAPACTAGYQRPCTATLGPGGEGRFAAGRSDYNQQLTITFSTAARSGPGIGPILVDPPSRQNDAPGAGAVLAGVAAAALLLAPAIWWAAARARRTPGRRDALKAARRPARTGPGRIVVALACALGGVAAGFAGGMLVLVFTAGLFSSGLAGAVFGMAFGPLFTVVSVVWLYARTGLGAWFGVVVSVLVVGSAIGMTMAGSAGSVSIGFAAPVVLGLLAYLTDPAHRHGAGAEPG